MKVRSTVSGYLCLFVVPGSMASSDAMFNSDTSGVSYILVSSIIYSSGSRLKAGVCSLSFLMLLSSSVTVALLMVMSLLNA